MSSLPWDERVTMVEDVFTRFIIIDKEYNVIDRSNDEKYILRKIIQESIKGNGSIEVFERTGFSKWRR
jgi:hypothetical protein